MGFERRIHISELTVSSAFSGVDRGWPEDFSERYDAHQKWLRREKGGARFVLRKGEELPRNLEGVDLARAILPRADLRDHNLRGASFIGAYMVGADFTGADGVGTFFGYARLHGSSFRQALLSQAHFENAKLSDAVFVGSNLCGARFKNADLRRANLSDLMGAGASFRGKKTDLRGAFLCRSNFLGANFTGSQRAGANFQQTYLAGPLPPYAIRSPLPGRARAPLPLALV